MSDESQRADAALASMAFIRERISNKLVDAAISTTAELRAEPGPGRAAVAIILRDVSAGPQVLLIRRAERKSDPWSGHMAFPGGREEPHDESLFATAVRETREEVALDLSETGRLLGELDVLPAIARGMQTGMVIAPFVFELMRDGPLVYNDAEVAEAVWVPLEALLRGALRTTVPYEHAGQRLDLPAHDFEGRIVWGLTYRMLDDLFALLR